MSFGAVSSSLLILLSISQSAICDDDFWDNRRYDHDDLIEDFFDNAGKVVAVFVGGLFLIIVACVVGVSWCTPSISRSWWSIRIWEPSKYMVWYTIPKCECVPKWKNVILLLSESHPFYVQKYFILLLTKILISVPFITYISWMAGSFAKIIATKIKYMCIVNITQY